LPYAYTQTPGNGSNRLFTVAFPFIVRAHVKVYLNYDVAAGTGTQLVDGTGFTWLSDTQIQTTVAPALGVTTTVIRKTPNGSQLVVWAPGSPPTPAELNTADLQSLYVIQEQADLTGAAVLTATAAAATANAAAAAVTGALLYQPVANVASIPASPVGGQRIEISNTTGLGTYSPVAGRPAGFVGSSGVKARLIYGTPTAAAWNWIDYFPVDPDGRYATIAAANTAQTTAANAATAAATAQTTAANAATAAQAAQAAATSAGTAAAGAQTTATNAATAAATAQTTATNAATVAAAAQARAERAPTLETAKSPAAGATNITFADIPSWVKRITLSWSGLAMASGFANLRLGTSSGLKTSGYGTAPSTNYTWIKSIGGGEAVYNNYTDFGVYSLVSIYPGSGSVSIVKISSTAWMISGMCLMPSATYVLGYQSYQVLASDLTQVALVGDGGATFSAGGTINMMYE
jgi:hypothetical protein